MITDSKRSIATLIKARRDRIRQYGVKRIGLFGSFVRGQQDSDSDVDVLVEFEPGQKTFDNYIQIVFFLEELLGRRVDLLTPESLSPYIGPRIRNEVEYVSLGA